MKVKIIKLLLITLFIDFLSSYFFFKKVSFWEQDNWKVKYWRISSDIYHHDLMPNINVQDKWGDLLKKSLITNSLGFVDGKNRKIEKINTKKKRVLLIGDSFIEGIGLDYEFTFAGLLQKHIEEKYEVLNSAVSSYSPSIYYLKTKYYLDKGYKFDKVLVFLDVSDIYDELFININLADEILNIKKEIQYNKSLKQKFYNFGYFLRDNFLIFRVFQIVSDKTEILKNYIKLKYKASKEMDLSFFSVNQEDVLFYRMRNIDRGSWTRNDQTYDEIKEGLIQSEYYLKKLFNLLKKNKIDSYLIIYPWPEQIYYGDTKHQPYWENFTTNNNINFINMYNDFFSHQPKDIILKNFIKGDVHWNKNGTKIIFRKIINEIKFN